GGHSPAARLTPWHHRQAVSGTSVSRRFSAGIVLTIVVMLVIALGVPQLVDQFELLQLTVFGAMCILALSLGFVWGYGGILCFGQSAFFGLGAYTYAVTAVTRARAPSPPSSRSWCRPSSPPCSVTSCSTAG